MLEAKSVTKTYGSTIANDDLSVLIRPGEILGVLGENGAGKSTFLSILAGKIQPDNGELLVDGTPSEFGAPGDALRAGVSIVFQHFSLIPTFTVREQLRLAGWRSKHLPELLRRRFTGHELIGEMSLGGRQMVEIARALASNPRILLLDEPTSILTTAETEQLFELVRDLRQGGTSVVIVTHKLHEAMNLCDRVVVLRQGRAVGEMERTGGHWPEEANSRLLRLMFGPEIELPEATVDVPAARAEAPPRPLFGVRAMGTTASPGRRALYGISLDVNENEICAIVGVDDQGQRELAELCAGYVAAPGTVALRGRGLPLGNRREFLRAGIAYLTGDRIGEGTVPGFSVEDNLVLKRQRDRPFSRHGLLRRRAIRREGREQISRWHIEPPNGAVPIGVLSGGNIQKVILARELAMASSLLIANNPAHGLDANTQHLVWRVIRRFAEGAGVLLFTSDIDEAITQADRIGVMYAGRLSPLLPVTSETRSQVERMMVSGW